MKYPEITAQQVILRIAVVIAVAEFFIMFGLEAYPYPFSHMTEAVLDVILLVLISSPVIYFWIINPFKRERDEAISELADMAYSDPLTGLPNRRVFLKSMEKTLAECTRHHIHAALILIDLDEFKNVNDTYGHDAGDAVLIEVGQRLQKGMRKEDIVSRVGGDEFIILIKQLNDDSDKAAKEAMAFAEKIKLSLAAPIKYTHKRIQLDSSLGINLLGSETYKIEAEIRKADVAMYHAKRMGKGHVVMYEASMVGRETNRNQ
ncbi:MAG TPA: GGDEF domain-containing protein [Gammaproteobacteria bacterium]|nr:GGDEF domain-containing protein [Gammaproteobacteria bacterium]